MLAQIRVPVTTVTVLNFIITSEKFMSFLSDVDPPRKSVFDIKLG